MSATIAVPREAGARPRRDATHLPPAVRLRATLDALRRWWKVGRHYRPERRYMRG